MLNMGDFPTGQTIYIPFHTFSSNDPSASMTITGLAVTDIEIYKDGSVTQRSSDSGYALLDTDGIDFDGITGIHGISIDTSDNTDAGFFAAGSDYWVVISSITLDAATVNFVAAIFSIDNRGLLRPTTVQRTIDITATGAAGIDWGNVENKTTANDLSATDIQLCDTVTTNTDMVGTDSAALASVCTETRLSELDAGTGGKMANQVDVIEVDTTSLNDTKIPDTISLANINTEVDNALDTALPASPTTGSINDILDRQEELIVSGAAATGTLSTTEMTTDMTISINDQYNGRILTFRKDTATAALQGQQTDITDTVTTDGKLTFTALTTAPANGDVFDIT